MNWGIVLRVDTILGDILVLDNDGYSTWWPSKRWRVISSKKDIKNLDIEVKLA